MSNEKNVKSRIQHKHDIEANWLKATNFIPKAGEIIIYDADDNYSYPRIKIGDGVQTVVDLPFSTGIQPDYTQNNPTAPDYVKNRTHWVEYKLGHAILPGTAVIEDMDGTHLPLPDGMSFEQIVALAGKECVVSCNGIEYKAKLKVKDLQYEDTTTTLCYLGNLNLLQMNAFDDTGESFLLLITNDVTIIITFGFNAGDIVAIHNLEEEIVHKLDPKYISEGGFGYITDEISEVFPETTITISGGEYASPVLVGLQQGKSYIVNWNGTEYACECKYIPESEEMSEIIFLGNAMLIGSEDDTGEPFIIAEMPGYGVLGVMTYLDDGDYTISIIGAVKYAHKIDEKFLPNTTWDYFGLRSEKIFGGIVTGFSEGIIVSFSPALFELVDKQQYEVIWDGNHYNLTAIDAIVGGSSSGIITLGNELFSSGDNTKQPFTIVYQSSDDTCGIVAIDADNESIDTSVDAHMVVINKRVLNPIPEKYLPESVVMAEELVENISGLQGQIDKKADTDHSHSYADIDHNHDDLYYTEAEINDMLDSVNRTISSKADANHSHSFNDMDDKPNIPSIEGLATEGYVDNAISEISNMLSSKADVNHSHSYNDLTDKPTIPSIEGLANESYVDSAISTHTHDDAYYTRSEIDDAHDSFVTKVDIVNNNYNYFVAYSDDGINYTGTVEGITMLKKGQILLMTPNIANTSNGGTNLNINNLGNRPVDRPMPGSGMYAIPKNWLAVDKFYELVYDGWTWHVISHAMLDPADLRGQVSIYNGGTGSSNPEEARAKLGITPENIGAATSGHSHSYNDLTDKPTIPIPIFDTIVGIDTNSTASMTAGEILAAHQSGSNVYIKYTNRVYEFVGASDSKVYFTCILNEEDIDDKVRCSQITIDNNAVVTQKTFWLADKDYVDQKVSNIDHRISNIDQRVSNKLDSSALSSAIDTALAQAKASGDFDGDDGKTPVKGTDYFTEADKQELVNAVLAALPTWTGGSY